MPPGWVMPDSGRWPRRLAEGAEGAKCMLGCRPCFHRTAMRASVLVQLAQGQQKCQEALSIPHTASPKP